MADVSISDLDSISVATTLQLPASNNTTTGKVTIADINSQITSNNVTTALGYTPYNNTNPNRYIDNTNASVAKAWVNFNGNGAVGNCVLNSFYNVSAVNKTASGAYTITFSPALGNVNYLTMVTCRNNADAAAIGYETSVTKSASQVSVGTYRIDGSGAVNPTKVFVVIFGG